MSATPFHIRAGTPADVAFVLGNWLNNHRRESPWAHRVTDDVYFGEYRPIIVALVQQSQVLVAHADDGSLLGEIVFQPETPMGPACHWVYVLKPFRKLGIGRALLEASGLPLDLAGVRITHPTRSWFTTKATGAGLEERFKAAIHDPCMPYLITIGATE